MRFGSRERRYAGVADAGGCAYYRVRADPYGKGDPSELGYGCTSVRAPTGIARPVAACGGSNPNCPPTSPPPLGTYICTEQVWQGPGAVPQYRPRNHGSITLLRGGRYRMFDDGAVGRYAYDETAYDSQYAASSPGSILTYAAIEDLFRADTPRLLDFGFGDGAYKRTFGRPERSPQNP